jgi:hypothetical protein
MVIKIVEQSPHLHWREEVESYELPITDYTFASYFGVKAGDQLHGCFHDIGGAMSEALKLQQTMALMGINSNIEVVKLGKG